MYGAPVASGMQLCLPSQARAAMLEAVPSLKQLAVARCHRYEQQVVAGDAVAQAVAYRQRAVAHRYKHFPIIVGRESNVLENHKSIVAFR